MCDTIRILCHLANGWNIEYSYISCDTSVDHVHCCFIFREWYSYHFPELVKIVNENYMYAKVAKFIKDRKSLSDESLEGLEEVVQDSAKAKAIVDAARMSMGRFD